MLSILGVYGGSYHASVNSREILIADKTGIILLLPGHQLSGTLLSGHSLYRTDEFTLTHFSPKSHFYTPENVRKRQKMSENVGCFQGA